MKISDDGFLQLSNDLAECKISLFGANIVSYRPKNEENDIFWLGDLNKFDNKQAIRGGIPVCWPRFAEEKLNSRLPRHGFARLSAWTVKNIHADKDKIEACLDLIPDEKYQLKATARLLIKITDKLEYCLETANDSEDIFEFSEALHAYFNISSLNETEIKGLAGHRYLSSLDGKTYTMAEDFRIKGEFDAAFLSAGNIEIIDKGFKRIISLKKEGSNTTVVWNPGKDLAEMSPGQYKKFVCVEPANQGESFVRLNPGENHKISMTVQVRKMA